MQIYSILYDLPNNRSKRNISCIPKEANDRDKYPELTRNFQILNQLFRDAQVVISHTAKLNRQTLTNFKELIHCKDRPWISTMDDFPWPGLEEFRQKKATLLNNVPIFPQEQNNAWLKLREICHHYKVPFHAKRMQNKAAILLNCLLKVPNLGNCLEKCKTI
jgi:hypothetical protein